LRGGRPTTKHPSSSRVSSRRAFAVATSPEESETTRKETTHRRNPSQRRSANSNQGSMVAAPQQSSGIEVKVVGAAAPDPRRPVPHRLGERQDDAHQVRKAHLSTRSRPRVELLQDHTRTSRGRGRRHERVHVHEADLLWEAHVLRFDPGFRGPYPREQYPSTSSTACRVPRTPSRSTSRKRQGRPVPSQGPRPCWPHPAS